MYVYAYRGTRDVCVDINRGMHTYIEAHVMYVYTYIEAHVMCVYTYKEAHVMYACVCIQRHT